MEYSVVPGQDSLPPDPQYEWQQQLANLPQQLQDQIDEHIEALEEVVIAYDPFDLIASLFCKNALAPPLRKMQTGRKMYHHSLHRSLAVEQRKIVHAHTVGRVQPFYVL